MNKTLPNSNPDETRTGKKLKARLSRLRPLDKGTVYDAEGSITRHMRRIQRGEYGKVTDMVMAIRTEKGGKTHVRTVFCGSGSVETLHFMAARLQRDILGGSFE